MHTVTDLVTLKTTIRQMVKRVGAESASAQQWENLSRNRGYPEVVRHLREAIESLDEAVDALGKAASCVYEAERRDEAGH